MIESQKKVENQEPVTIKVIKPPFYRSVSFYISVLALAVSAASLFVSYATSPFSKFSHPKLTYGYKTHSTELPNKVSLFMSGWLHNPTRLPAKDVVVTIVCIPEQKPKLNVVVSGGIEYKIIENTANIAAIKFPNFPPGFFCSIIIQGSCSKKYWEKYGKKIREKPFDFVDVIMITSVTHEKGMGFGPQGSIRE